MPRNDRFLWIVLACIGAAAVFLVLRDTVGGRAADFGGDGIGHAFYLGILGMVVAAGIFGSRRSLGTAARSLAAWILIVLALVAGYQYRYELQDVASRVTAGLIPGSPLSISDSDGRTTVTLEKSPSGHFEARATVDGAPLWMVVDTGATTTVLTAADAASAGVDTAALRYQIPVSTANGQAMAAQTVLKDISVGAISRVNMPALVAADGMLDQSLLGMNFLGTLSGYDIRGDRLILRD